jgi:hypothetical protein
MVNIFMVGGYLSDAQVFAPLDYSIDKDDYIMNKNFTYL